MNTKNNQATHLVEEETLLMANPWLQKIAEECGLYIAPNNQKVALLEVEFFAEKVREAALQEAAQCCEKESQTLLSLRSFLAANTAQDCARTIQDLISIKTPAVVDSIGNKDPAAIAELPTNRGNLGKIILNECGQFTGFLNRGKEERVGELRVSSQTRSNVIKEQSIPAEVPTGPNWKALLEEAALLIEEGQRVKGKFLFNSHKDQTVADGLRALISSAPAVPDKSLN